MMSTVDVISSSWTTTPDTNSWWNVSSPVNTSGSVHLTYYTLIPPVRSHTDDFEGVAEVSLSESAGGGEAAEEGFSWREVDYGGHVAAGIALILLAIITTLGNSLVIHAIRTEKRLRTVSNLFLMSLAVADLIIGVIVMPITAAYTIAGQWRWGEDVCKFWLATDYTASTASIFNLVVLTLDRYWSVMAPLRYLRRRTRKRALVLIGSAWAAASLWLLPVLLWGHLSPGSAAQRDPHECETDFAHSILFKLVTSALNFYLPSALIVVLYYRIFKTIQKRTSSFPQSINQHKHDTVQQTTSSSSVTQADRNNHKKKVNKKSSSRCANKKSQNDVCVETQMFEALTVVGADEEPSTASCFRGVTVQVEYLSDRSHHMHHRACYPPCHMKNLPGRANSNNNQHLNAGNRNKHYRNLSPTRLTRGMPNSAMSCGANVSYNSATLAAKCRKPGNLNLAKERKAARQLGIIMGVFLACWLPYFTIFPVIALCSSCVPYSAHMATITLGYLNSALNPAIYPLCNHHFRRAFQRMVRCREHQPPTEHLVCTLPPPNH